MEKLTKTNPSSPTAQFVRAVRAKLELTQLLFGEHFGRSKQNISFWELGAHEPSYDQLVKMSELSGIPLPDSGSRPQSEAKAGQQDFDVFEYVGGRVPVVGEARLGEFGYYEEQQGLSGQDGWVKYPASNGAYALRCRGDSMRPRIKPGEFVIVEPDHSVSYGDEVAVQTRDGRKMIKVLANRRDGFVELHSINEEHKPITFEEHEILTMHYVAGTVKSAMYYDE